MLIKMNPNENCIHITVINTNISLQYALYLQFSHPAEHN